MKEKQTYCIVLSFIQYVSEDIALNYMYIVGARLFQKKCQVTWATQVTYIYESVSVIVRRSYTAKSTYSNFSFTLFIDKQYELMINKKASISVVNLCFTGMVVRWERRSGVTKL